MKESNNFILTFSPDECQTKSFEKMNTLHSVIFKFCANKNLLKKNVKKQEKNETKKTFFAVLIVPRLLGNIC